MSAPLIRIVDLETTGLKPPEAAVCEIGWSDLHEGRIRHPTAYFVQPGHPIPPETSAIHHIVDADVRNGIEWDAALLLLLDPIPAEVGCLAAHNARFERQFITDEMTGGLPFICTYKCGLRLWPDAPAHGNQVLRYWRGPAGLDRETANLSHRAGPDAYVTAFLLREMLEVASVEQLVAWSTEPALLRKCNFGKHRGTLWADVPSDYLSWASRQDMDEDTAFTIRHEMQRRRQA